MSSDEQNASDSRRMQVEAMHRALASTVVEQLAGSGCEPGQLIDFASEVLRCIMDRGFEDAAAPVERPGGADGGRQTIVYRLGGSREGLVEGGLEVVLAADLAADSADQPAEAGAQEAQLTLVAAELFGGGVAAGHQGGALGQPQIGLA